MINTSLTEVDSIALRLILYDDRPKILIYCAVGGTKKIPKFELIWRWKMMVSLGRYDKEMVDTAGLLGLRYNGFGWREFPLPCNREFYIAARSLSDAPTYLVDLLTYELNNCGSIDIIYLRNLLLSAKYMPKPPILESYLANIIEMYGSVEGIEERIYAYTLSTYLFMVLCGNAVMV
jgi:hypothetical protein